VKAEGHGHGHVTRRRQGRSDREPLGVESDVEPKPCAGTGRRRSVRVARRTREWPSFAATSTADAESVGAYAGVGHSGRAATGTFAGDAEEQRRAGFGDVDRETVTTYRDGVKRVRIASHHNLMQMLLDAGLDAATAASDVEALHHGRILVLVRSTKALDEVARVIEV
jgi:hypothetical protein